MVILMKISTGYNGFESGWGIFFTVFFLLATDDQFLIITSGAMEM